MTHGSPLADIATNSFDQLQSDKDLLNYLDLSEAEAGKALGRSRQSLYQAGLGARTDYFKSNDVRVLLLLARGKSPSIDLGIVFAYLTISRGEQFSADIASIIGGMSEVRASLDAYNELWIVIPDVVQIRRDYPQSIKDVADLAKSPGISTLVLVSNEHDKAVIRAEIGESPSVDVKVETWMAALPYLIIGNPKRIADCFVFYSGKFLRQKSFSGARLALLINTLVKADVAPEVDL